MIGLILKLQAVAKKISVNKLAILFVVFWCSIQNVNANDIPATKEFKVKGFHLDLRIQVMKMPALKAFAKKLSQNGINTLVMEWEATYPYQKHAVISEISIVKSTVR